MAHGKHGNRAAVVWPRALAVLALMLTTLAGMAPAVAAQGGSVDVAIYTTENGQTAYDACYVLVGYSNEGCDENADGKVTFADIPVGTYTVQQTANLGPGRSVADFTINVTGNVNSEGYEGFTATIVITSGSSSGSGSSDVAIVTTENGQSAYDACYVLVDYSNEGCDENRDGKITFEDIPLGSYTVRQAADLGPNRSVADFTIQVTGSMDSDGWERFPATIVNTSGPEQLRDMQISAIACDSADPAAIQAGMNGDGSCYWDIGATFSVTTQNGDYIGSCTLVGDRNAEIRIAGNVNCTVPVPIGVNVIVTEDVSTITPGTAPRENPLTYTWPTDPAAVASYMGVVFQNLPTDGGTSPGSSGAKDISLITRDPGDGHLLTGTCYVLLDYSNEGCDENGDGQVTFDDMPPGTYTVRQTRTPVGYPTINDFPIMIDDAFQNVPVGYIVRQAREQSTPGKRNTSVIFVDSSTQTKVTSSTCLQFRNVSNVGCDRDLVDGQVDFLDLAVGAHEVTFSNMPAGWQVLGGVGPSTVNIVAGPGPQIIYMQVLTGNGSGSGGGGATAETGAIAVVGGDQTGTGSAGSPSDGATTTGPAVELILDTSGSMNERDQGNQTRLEVAKTVTTRLVTETLPAGVPMALRTCSGCSSSLAIPMHPLDPAAASSTIANLRASGSTPIGQSLRAASADLANVPGPKIIVLVTDGEETCGGDPRAAIEALVAQDVNVQVNIVGFANDDAELTATFQEWARVGNGTYFEASNALELDQAVTAASQLSFRVLDQQGAEIASGTVGGDPVSVPVGTYTVEVNTAPVTLFENVVVRAQETTTIDLGN